MGSQLVKIALQADVGGFIKGFSQADSAAGKFGATISGLTNVAGAVGNAIDAMADKAQKFARKVAAGGAAGTLFFGGLGVAAARLEAPLKNVQTLMGQDFGERQFQQMTDTVINMSRRLPQSATDLANGLYNIASSGFYGSDALKVLDASATAATAGLTTTQNASTAVTAALNAYGLGASHARDISDILFQTVNLGVVSFEQLTGVIGDAVGTAAAAHVSFAQVGAAIATMTLSGISAEESGTSLNRLLQSLIDPSAALAGALHGLGYESGEAALKQDGLRGVMDKLRVASQGNISTLLAWFPEIRAARGALALMSNEGENYARVADQIESKQARAGATQRAFNIQMDGTLMQFQKLVNGLKAAGLEIGQYFLPVGRAILQFATGIVDAFSEIPGPIKQAIGWFGALSSALLALGGIFLAWRLKSMVTGLALKGIGTAAQSVGRQLGDSGRAFTEFGNRASSITGPFAVTRTVIGTTSSLFSSLGSHIGNAGRTIEAFGSGLSHGGGLVAGFGNALTKVEGSGRMLTTTLGALGRGLSNLVGYLPAAAALGMALFSAFEQGKSAAKDFSEELTKHMNDKDPMSLVKNYQKVQDNIDRIDKSIKNSQQSAGGFFGQVRENIEDLASGAVGIDWIQDSSWDKQFKINELQGTEKKIATSLHNMSRNVTEVYNTLHPDKALAPGKLLGLNSDDFLYISRVAEQAGVDLTKTFSKSGPERQKAMQDVQKLGSFLFGLSTTSASVSTEMIKQYAAIAKASDKAADGASKAFNKSFDLFKSINPDQGNVGQQISDFYSKSLDSATKFYDGIQQLQARGADPSVIQKMLQAGPEAAGAVVQAAVDDTTGGVIQTLNAGEKALQQFSARAAEIARLTQQAIMSPGDQKTKDLPLATQISNEVFKQGNLATTETVAKALSLDPASVKKITGEFGITLRDDLKPEDVFKSFLGPDAQGPISPVQERIMGIVNAMRAYTNLPIETITNLSKGLGKVLAMPDITPQDMAKKRVAVEQLLDTAANIPDAQDKAIVFKIIGDQIAKDKMRDVLEAAFGPGRANQQGTPGLTEQQIEYLISVQGDADAVAKVSAFADSINATPAEKAVMIRALGTDEAIHQADLIDAAIEVLHGKDLPITADNVQAIIASGEAQKHIDAVNQGHVPGIAADPTGATVAAAQAQAAIDAVHGKDVQINAIYRVIDAGNLAPGQGLYDPTSGSAYGNIYKNGIKAFASGGMSPMIGNGRHAILWNEPGTGGESYIPWAMDRRGRATRILATTADVFGYELVKKVKAYAQGGMPYYVSASSPSLGGKSGISIVTPINFNAPIYGEEGMKEVARKVIDSRDRQLEVNLRRNRSGVV